MKKMNKLTLIIGFITTMFSLNQNLAFPQSWSAVGTGTNNDILCQTIYNSDLISGGTFTTAGGNTVNRIAKWNGSNWSALGTGLNDRPNAVVVYNGELIAAGRFTNAGGVAANRIAKWNGTVWSAHGT